MIPKIIHYCWLGEDEYPPLVKKCIQSWKENLPGWKLRLWDKSCIEEINEPWVKEAYQAIRVQAKLTPFSDYTPKNPEDYYGDDSGLAFGKGYS